MAVLNFYNDQDGNMWREYEGISSGNGGFNIGKTTVRVYGALRFENVTIPQGTTVASATLKIYVGDKGAGSGSLLCQYWGIDEDNTGTFSSDPLGRTKTTATHSPNISVTSVGNFQDLDVADEVNEIFARAGWSSGNALGFIFNPRDGTPDDLYMYDNNTGTSTNSYLVITYNAPSESKSASKSASRSISPSSSYSPSASLSPSPSASPSPLPTFRKGIVKVAKDGINALTNSDPNKFIFNSDYGTLKYYSKQTATVTFDAGSYDAGTATITHNLGYYPYVEVFVSVYIGAASGVYEYCPFAGSGAAVAYDANYKITTTTLEVYGQINGSSVSTWNFAFLAFIYKNDLSL